MRIWCRWLAAVVAAVVVTLTLTATPAQAAPNNDRLGTAAGQGVWVALYPTGVVVTFDRWNTGYIAASSAFTSVWVAAAAAGGQLGNTLNQNIWTIQVRAVWEVYNGLGRAVNRHPRPTVTK